MNTQTIYRIENPKTNHGMWYNQKGEYNPFILTLTEGKSAHLPMEPHPRYGQTGQRWYSGCQNINQLKQWFSTQDILELNNAGYKLYQFETTEYINEEHQTIFTRRGILTQTELNIIETILN